MTESLPRRKLRAEDSDFKLLTAQEAHGGASVIRRCPVRRLVEYRLWQVCSVSLVAWAVSVKLPVAWSAGYGALAVVCLRRCSQRGMAARSGRCPQASAMVGFFGWEMVEIALTVSHAGGCAGHSVATELAGVAGGHGGLMKHYIGWNRPVVSKTD